MRRAVVILLATLAVTAAAACSGSDAAPPPLDTEPATTSAPTTEAPATVSPSTEPADTVAETTIAPAPTTTVLSDEDILAQAEADFLEAFAIGTEMIRSPDDPDNAALAVAYFAESNLELLLENLTLTREGNFVAKENADNPSFAQTYGDIAFVGETRTRATLTVCEFYSDRLFERRASPDGSDTLVRDDPVTTILQVDLVLDEGRWKSAAGGVAEEVRDDVERCTTAS